MQVLPLYPVPQQIRMQSDWDDRGWPVPADGGSHGKESEGTRRDG